MAKGFDGTRAKRIPKGPLGDSVKAGDNMEDAWIGDQGRSEQVWAENKEYKYHWCFIVVLRAPSRLYRRRSLQANTNFSAFCLDLQDVCILLDLLNPI